MRLCGPYSIVFGSGIRDRKQRIMPGRARFVRGPITRKRLLEVGGECPPIFGDPALLLSQYYRPRKTQSKIRLGIVPHYTEYDRLREMYDGYKDVRVIDMGCGDIEEVVDQIVSCYSIVSSSLHGIIISNSYGIPVRWIKFSDNIYGDDTKYRDHFASIGRPDETYIDAVHFGKLEIDELCSQIKEYEIQIDLERLSDEMFFDEHGMRSSILYSKDS